MTHRLLMSAIVAAALVGCKTDEPNPPALDEDIGLRRMASCDDIKERLADTVTDSVLGYGGRGGFFPPMAENDASGDGGGGSGPTDFTGTNNQEAGVDELDLVKTNGTHMFIAQDRSLRVLKSWPAAETALLASLPLDGWARGLFLVDDDTVVVLEDVSGYVQVDERWYSALRARVVDVSDPNAPTTTHTVDLQGWLTDARMIEGQVYLIANQYMDLPQDVWEAAWQAAAGLTWPTTYDEATWEAARVVNRAQLRPVIGALIAGANLDEILPGYRTDGAADFTALYACTDIYAPLQSTPLAMLSVAQLDPASGTLSATGLMSDGWTVYASPQNLYVAQTSGWWWGWTGDIGRTHIHRFDLTGPSPDYTGSGAVNGWIYDQFAMSEYNGDLRVVTTDFGWWGRGDVAVDGGVSEGGGSTPPSDGGDDPAEPPPDEPPAGDQDTPDTTTTPEPPQPANHVYVLRPSANGALTEIGHVGGIAPGETVQSVRMMGEKGYVVTFLQVDPLFTLDLSDPTAPRVAGELHMPGFSAYLHPLGDNHLIGVGMAGLETGQLTGLAVNLFDVSDMANPQLVGQYELDPGEDVWSWSEAMWDHHAFTFHRDVLTLPAFSYSWDSETWEYDGFSGTISLHITAADGIDELGRVDHHDLVAASECIYDILWGEQSWGDDGEPKPDEGTEPGDDGGGTDPGSEDPSGGDAEWSYCDWDYGYWYAQVRRSVYIEDNLYTISDYGVKVNDLNDPSISIANVMFYPAPTE